jgi:hypothetical protein
MEAEQRTSKRRPSALAYETMVAAEDGNNDAAIRIYTLQTIVMQTTAHQTLQTLHQRHPRASSDGQQFADSGKFPTAQFDETGRISWRRPSWRPASTTPVQIS